MGIIDGWPDGRRAMILGFFWIGDNTCVNIRLLPAVRSCYVVCTVRGFCSMKCVSTNNLKRNHLWDNYARHRPSGAGMQCEFLDE